MNKLPMHDLLVVSCGQVASLAFLVYEIFITLDDEVNMIWSKRRESWIKWQFLFTRYFALAAQIANRSIENTVTGHKISMTAALRSWYMCQVVIGATLMSAVELVLMARVYALYNKRKYIGLTFVCLIVAEIVTVVVGVIRTTPGSDFVPYDILLTSPNSFTYFGISAIVSQITIIGLTLLKYKSAVQAFCILLVITTLTVVGTSLQNEYAPIGNSWFLSIVSSAGCRLIINMQQLPNPTCTLPTNERQTTIQLTTLWNDEDEAH